MKDVTGSSTAVTCQVPGSRGLDWMQKTTGSGTVVAYPVYDAHGNMIATLSRSGSASYALNDQRSYDAWGGIRSGNTSGDPKHQHCANLGHVADDESGLVYMRARHYESVTGRFCSIDPASRGWNHYALCHSDPINYVDRSGKAEEMAGGAGKGIVVLQGLAFVVAFEIGYEVGHLVFEKVHEQSIREGAAGASVDDLERIAKFHSKLLGAYPKHRDWCLFPRNCARMPGRNGLLPGGLRCGFHRSSRDGWIRARLYSGVHDRFVHQRYRRLLSCA